MEKKILFNRVRLILDDDRPARLLNADGSIAGLIPYETIRDWKSQCHLCSALVTQWNAHVLGTVVRGVSDDLSKAPRRVLIWREWTFCSANCRKAWWSGRADAEWNADEPFARIDTPATLEWYVCGCQGVEPFTVLAGVGELVSVQIGNLLHLKNQDEETIHCVELRNPKAECDRCNGTRTQSNAPGFFHGRPGDFGWRDAWAERIDFDRELTMTVFHTDPGQQQRMEWTSETDFRLLPELIVERWKFSDPHTLNAWWLEPVTEEERVIIEAVRA